MTGREGKEREISLVLRGADEIVRRYVKSKIEASS
jgi:hypothetical protein